MLTGTQVLNTSKQGRRIPSLNTVKVNNGFVTSEISEHGAIVRYRLA